MLIFRMLKKEFLGKPSIFLVIFFFIALSALLMANGTSLIIHLSSSLDAFFVKAKTPHFVQMHSGIFSQKELEAWSKNNSKVERYQLVEMISVPGSKLFWGQEQEVLDNSVMDISFVEQNSNFDYLLDLDNQVIKVNTGEVAVPIYFREKYKLKVGNQLVLKSGQSVFKFKIVSFIRDSQMNPAIIHSKRFLVSGYDKAKIMETFPQTEYLIEYRLKNLDDLSDFERDYQMSDMPKVGPTLSINLFKLLNSLSDGLVAGLVIIISLIIMLIAVLCLRFVILSSIEEDLREIGVMKAIGIPQNKIKNIYNYKYLLMSYLALLVGYAVSFTTNDLLLKNLLLYTGKAPTSWQNLILPFIAVNLIIILIAISLRLIIRKIGKITSVAAINLSRSEGKSTTNPLLSLRINKFWNVEFFLGLREIVQKFKLYWLLLVIFIFAVFIIILPFNIYNTINSPNFITYMGIGKSDIRIDLRNSLDINEDYELINKSLSLDKDVKIYSNYITSKYDLILADGSKETITIESGDSQNFPLSYLKGHAPSNIEEISISALNANELQKDLNDTLKVMVGEQEKILTITGIYQDITNGGKSAKAHLDYNPDNVLWYTILVDLKNGIDIDKKLNEYKLVLPSARVTDIPGYLEQTFGNTIDQVKQVAMITGLAGLFITLFITLLFLKMVVNKDVSSIAIMISQGFSKESIQLQYIFRTIFLLGFGVILGVLLTYTFGERLITLFSSMIGIANFNFDLEPTFIFVIVPLTLIITVSITTVISLRSLSSENLVRRITQ